ncbi:MAG: dockerin type I domain-containing protein [Oscillospiraceae bacterium]
MNGDGLINAADIAEMRKTAMSLGAPDDRTVSDIDADGETNIIDLIKLKKYRAGICELSQGRMLAASSRFTNRAVSSVEGYEESFEDLSAASKDIELTFGRYYNSEETDGNMLGGGWTASFEGCVSLSDGSATVCIYGRAPLTFKYENGKYSSSSSRARLENSSSGFVFTDESGIKYTFGTAGFLVKITDKNGNNTEIGVNSAGKIQKVTDSVGREYLYAYNESGRLSSVTDCMQRTVGYTYNEDGRLSSVIGVLGTVTGAICTMRTAGL